MNRPWSRRALLACAGLATPLWRSQLFADESPATVPEYSAEPVAAPDIRAASTDPAGWLRRLAGGRLEFRTTGQPAELALVPLNEILDERFAVYWRIQST